jgi:hypothetical protein
MSDSLAPETLELNSWGMTLLLHRPLSHCFEVLSQDGFCIDVVKEPGSEPVPSEDVLPSTQAGATVCRHLPLLWQGPFENAELRLTNRSTGLEIRQRSLPAGGLWRWAELKRPGKLWEEHGLC